MELSEKMNKLYDKDGMEKVMRPIDYATDAVGQVALNSITVLSGQMTYFYTNKVGMAAATVGTVLLVAKIVDAVTDLIMGKLVDKTNTKRGKARPWLLRMLIPTMAAIILLFTVPANAGSFRYVYALLTNIFASAICYTAVAVPYYTMIAYKTRSSEEKGNIGRFRSAVGYAVGVGLGIGLIPITTALGDDQRAWVILAAVLSILSGIGLLITYKFSQERYVESDGSQEKESHISIVEGIKILVKNKYWVKITVFGVCMNIMYAIIMAAPIYYALFVAGDQAFYSTINTVNLIPSILGFLTVGFFIKRFGLTKTAKIASIIGIVGSLVRVAFPGSIPVTLIAGSVVMYATIPLISVLPALVLNTSEINFKNVGVRMTGMTNASNSFVGKIGSGLGGALVGWVLAWGGIDAVNKGGAMTNKLLSAVYITNIYIPLIMFIIMLIIIWKYDLEEKLPALIKENAEKEAQE
ncbi:MAG TPA: sugar (glycoside-pentoside-Hexuronide) transporter [Erysipelotrichaceae bacterium]|nr:sugar (glycoside-pentoside-Hexuronide) transporter [Erysipelotrichaceae bacterium]HAV18841.1 sugar (glycoside-pentoside-Hexuronide) transporter [Erysipelotrichaceae bacterium]HBG85131.1 sugar (glycoside-pentoside-Hexuronide) transporter [Erysipelotrichaceae bacterium]HBZ50531.1 sugar (glycoside-pentoside-Hexuronide) transporter [Erysipelotrichaceae bacterium]HCG98167.1 sugar (glycoside-pentoside-Hexuronide) transporter [Erysipelotrichaceae bacterium]